MNPRTPQITARELIAFLKQQGFTVDRQTGSHQTLRHAERRVTVTVPVHGNCDIGRGLTAKILRDAGFTVEDYLRLR